MTKKIFYILTSVIIHHQAIMPALSTQITKVVPPSSISAVTSKIPGFGTVTTANSAQSAISYPRVHLNSEQIKLMANDLSSLGAREYLPQIQMLWETNPELMYNAQIAAQKTDLASRRIYMNQTIQEAKAMSSAGSKRFSVQDAIVRNPQLENLVNQELATNLESIGRNLTEISYNGKLLSSFPNKNKYYSEIGNPFSSLQRNIDDIFNSTKNTPQDAASKINGELDTIKDIQADVQALAESITNSELKEIMTSIGSGFNTVEQILTSIKEILQKTSTSSQKRSATLPELKNLIESFNATKAQAQANLQPFESGAISNPIPMPTAVKPFFNAQTNLAKAEMTTAAQNLVAFKKQIDDLGLPADKREIFRVQMNSTASALKVLSAMNKEIAALFDHPDALTQIKEMETMISTIVATIIDSLAKLNNETNELLHSEQGSALDLLAKIVNAVKSIESNFRTTQLVLEEAHANKEVMAQIKKDMDLAEFVFKSQKDLATVQATAKSISRILSSRGDVLKTDKAPMGMLQVFEEKIAEYNKMIKKIESVTDLADLATLQTELNKEQTEILTTLDSLFSKIANLPTSSSKNQSLDACRKLKAEFMQAKRSVDNLFAQAGKTQEKHLFVNIKKDELEMGILTILEPAKALRMSIKKDFDPSRLTTEQHGLLSELERMIDARQADLQKVKRIQTSLELDTFTQEFFKQQGIENLAKKFTSLVPVGSTSVISIAEPSLAVPFGTVLAVPAGKPYYPHMPYIEDFTEDFNALLSKMLWAFGITLSVAIVGDVVTWVVKPVEKKSATWTPATDTSISEIKDIGLSSIIQTGIHKEPQQPKNETEFIQKSDAILKEADDLDTIPSTDLEKVIQDLEDNIQMLNLSSFKEAGLIFLNKLQATVNRATSLAQGKFNHFKVNLLKALHDDIEKNKKELSEDQKYKIFKKYIAKKSLPTNDKFRSQYQEVMDLLNKYIKNS